MSKIGSSEKARTKKIVIESKIFSVPSAGLFAFQVLFYLILKTLRKDSPESGKIWKQRSSAQSERQRVCVWAAALRNTLGFCRK